MKLGLKEKINNIITAYKENCKTQGEEIKQVLEPFKVPSYMNRFTQEGLMLEIKEGMDEILGNWKKYDKLMNDQVATIIAAAKKEIMEALHINQSKKAADYAVRVANAREFLKMELESDNYQYQAATPKMIAELDAAVFPILKDFMDDYETMKLFAKMIEIKTDIPTVTASGEPSLPKVFGRMMKVDSIMNTVGEIEEYAAILFLHARTNVDEVIRIKGASFGVPADGYSQQSDEENIISCATILDALADKIDSEGQGSASQEGVASVVSPASSEGQDVGAES